MEKKALLVVSFGTSHADTRAKTIDAVERALAAAAPDRRFYRAWTSGMIIRRLARAGEIVPTVAEAMASMAADGVTDILVQPTHVLPGVEYDLMRADIADAARGFSPVLRFGAPLLADDADLARITEILGARFGDLPADTALLCMGHGTEHFAGAAYAALDYRFKRAGHRSFYMATVEGYPAFDDALAMLRERPELRRVVLLPFMIVAGDHAKNDMAGPDPDSWRSRLEAAGYGTECVLRGLGEDEAVRAMFVAHAQAAEG